MEVDPSFKQVMEQIRESGITEPTLCPDGTVLHPLIAASDIANMDKDKAPRPRLGRGRTWLELRDIYNPTTSPVVPPVDDMPPPNGDNVAEKQPSVSSRAVGKQPEKGKESADFEEEKARALTSPTTDMDIVRLHDQLNTICTNQWTGPNMGPTNAPSHNTVASPSATSMDSKAVGRKRYGGQPRSCRRAGHGRSATTSTQPGSYLRGDDDSKHPHVPHDSPLLGSVRSFLLGSRCLSRSATCIDVWEWYLEQHKRQIVQDSGWRGCAAKLVES